ncbi:Clan CA, family C12, ubiquitin hydrolase-like cysteine peptidase [Histomonas meleagridis]|uniref:Clan CA, family C12, ubiquitin hydrolase-like cysteine peptidase n=1 Tax=Histomonas meleagridis TaxID=135588 RepID=UPI0035597FB4|nr:Clan CA, family C12, ubiquitin hydrolase-like cysteine peptidase [Histomonas meleagridis]KAH0796913.1 Clan CA, family C12, ubiquitin hydrolase-like cysteine peptidase [Histomonas meleagridis]
MCENEEIVPLSNEPQDITAYTSKLGLDPSSATFTEIFSFEEEYLALIPKPIYAIILLYPMGPKEEEGVLWKRHMEIQEIPDPSPWFTLQKVSNCCGTIAIIHSIMNNLENVKIVENSWFDRFAKKTKTMTPNERADLVCSDKELLTVHTKAAKESSVPIPENCFTHFASFVVKYGYLWELDGRKPQPICHGRCNDLLESTINVIKTEFIPSVKNPMEITILGLTACP